MGPHPLTRIVWPAMGPVTLSARRMPWMATPRGSAAVAVRVVADAPLNSFTAVRTVDVLVDASSSPPDFTTLEGADKVRVRGNRVTFEWTGDPNVLVDKLRKCQLTALTVGEPDLEATLRSYYCAV